MSHDRARTSAAALTPAPGRAIRLLYFVREPFPTRRVDVDVLFGEELLGRGHAIDFVMQAAGDEIRPGPHAWRGRTVWVGETDAQDGFVHRLRKHVLNFLNDLRCLRAITRERYDAVQVRDKFLIAAIIAMLARSRGVRFYYWLSFPHPEELLLRARSGLARYPALTYLRGALSWWILYRWILRRCDHAFVQSEQMRADVAAQGISPAKLTPVPMGIALGDVPAPHAAPVSGAAAPPTVTLAYLGTLDSQRRLEILVDMLHLVREGGIAARLLMVGDGEKPEDRQRLEKRARELGVGEHLDITGFLPRHEALSRVRTADVCLSPFFPTAILRSTSPTKLVEYLALGLPVIANDHPEQRLVLRESRAGVCVPWDARHFARAVRWLVACGAARRREMGLAGRAWVVQNRTYAKIGDELEAKYLALQSSSSADARARRA